MNKFRILLVSLALMWAGAASAVPLLTFTGGGEADNFNQTVGWRFNVLQPLVLTGLEWYDEGGDGLDVAHQVGLWSPSGALTTSAVIPAGTAAPLMGGVWREVSVAETFLSVGMGYIVGGQNFANSFDPVRCGGGLAGDACGAPLNINPSNLISFTGATFSGFGGFQIPTNNAALSNGLFGPGIAGRAPEPASLALLIAGLVGLAGLRFGSRGRP